MDTDSGAGDAGVVSLTIPARADYVALARLALAAVCRQTVLAPEALADLKLAVTEAAGGFVYEDGAADSDPDGRLSFRFGLDLERLVVELQGAPRRSLTEEERKLSREIIEATVDECTPWFDGIRLVKYLDGDAD